MSEQDFGDRFLDLRTFIRSSGSQITVQELCSVPGLTVSVLTEMVAFGIVEPSSGDSPAQWMFTSLAANRSMRALRLLHDLELNLAGAALALELMDELQVARARLRSLEHHGDDFIEKGKV